MYMSLKHIWMKYFIFHKHKHTVNIILVRDPHQIIKDIENILEVWDDKITTLPGLYLVGVLWNQIWSFMGSSNGCSLTAVRSVNGIFALGIFYLLQKIVAPHVSKRRRCLSIVHYYYLHSIQ